MNVQKEATTAFEGSSAEKSCRARNSTVAVINVNDIISLLEEMAPVLHDIQ